jgi:alcohol dehydrogenase, propanol-preferring
MKAAVLSAPASIVSRPLEIRNIPVPTPAPGQILLRVRACGVCRTDLHIVEGELKPLRPHVIPGHQIVGEALDSNGARLGVTWMAGIDGTCQFCLRGEENLCDSPAFTGYTVDGGYAEYAVARSDFAIPLPAGLDNLETAPLLCAGVIGFRSLRVAGVQRGATHRKLAESLGADWVGSELNPPPTPLDRAITFAPSGQVVVAALSSLRKGGVVAINAIHLDRIPEFDYNSLLWGERQIRSVTNVTRADARDFLQLASEIKLRPKVTAFRLDQANEALLALKNDAIDGAAVLVP